MALGALTRGVGNTHKHRALFFANDKTITALTFKLLTAFAPFHRAFLRICLLALRRRGERCRSFSMPLQ